MKMPEKLPRHVISGKKLLCATTISTHYQQIHSFLMENPISLYVGRMVMGITKILGCLMVCIYVLVDCTVHLATINLWKKVRKTED